MSAFESEDQPIEDVLAPEQEYNELAETILGCELPLLPPHQHLPHKYYWGPESKRPKPVLGMMTESQDHELAAKVCKKTNLSLTEWRDLDLEGRLPWMQITVDQMNVSDAASPTEHSDQFVPTSLQEAILKALDGRALKTDDLADKCCGGDRSRLYDMNRKQKTGGLNELKARGLVKHKRTVGYYRPDARPPSATN